MTLSFDELFKHNTERVLALSTGHLRRSTMERLDAEDGSDDGMPVCRSKTNDGGNGWLVYTGSVPALDLGYVPGELLYLISLANSADYFWIRFDCDRLPDPALPVFDYERD